MSRSGDLDPTLGFPLTGDSTDRIGPYHLLQKIGEGGMGDVWIAEQREPIRRTVAIKVIKIGMDTRQVVSRFEAERQALAVMDHPAIAKVLDAGATVQGRPYFVMEYVRGEPITDYCDRQRLSTADRLGLFTRVCEGVQHAHQKGIIHRDLKPSNILVTIQDGQSVPKIIDFGIAKATGHSLSDQAVFTELGVLVGTPEYMSPEQAEMTGLDIDTRTDVYSLGVLLYQLLTGTLPFESKTLREKALDEIRRTIRHVEPPRPSSRITKLGSASTEAAKNRLTEPGRLAGQLRGDLDWITMRALEKDRTRRYETAIGLANDVRRHLNHEPVSAGPPSAAYRTRKFVRRHRVGVAAAMFIVTLLAAFAGIMTVQAGRIARERDRANQEASAARQVSDFLVGLFKVSDPSEARGNTLTAREILARGANQIDDNLRDQPQVQARLQATIGGVYTELGHYADAQPLLERALRAQTRLLGEDSSETLATENELANVFWYRQRYTDAEPLYRNIVDRRTKVLGADHPDTLRSAYDLASLYAEQKRWAEFEPLARDTLDRQRRVLGRHHPDTLNSLGNLGSAYYRQGRYAEAEPFAVEDVDGLRSALGEDHPSTLNAMHNLATVYDKLGRYTEAEAVFLKTLAARRRVLGDEHPRTCLTLSRLASMYTNQHRYQEAESAAMAAYQGYVKRLGDGDERTRSAVEQLADLYAAAGQPDKAEEWRAKLRNK